VARGFGPFGPFGNAIWNAGAALIMHAAAAMVVGTRAGSATPGIADLMQVLAHGEVPGAGCCSQHIVWRLAAQRSNALGAGAARDQETDWREAAGLGGTRNQCPTLPQREFPQKARLSGGPHECVRWKRVGCEADGLEVGQVLGRPVADGPEARGDLVGVQVASHTPQQLRRDVNWRCGATGLRA
jgi:hypothetical protein